jgi:hypothetical protein
MSLLFLYYNYPLLNKALIHSLIAVNPCYKYSPDSCWVVGENEKNKKKAIQSLNFIN